MTSNRVRRRDGTFFDAAPGYILQDGEGHVTPHAFMDTAGQSIKLTDEQVLDYVRAEMRPKDTSRLSAAQLRRAFVAMRLEQSGDKSEMALGASDAFIEGAFKALTADLNARHLVDPRMIETTPDGAMRDSVGIVIDGTAITPEIAKAHGYDSAAALVKDETTREAAYDVACIDLQNAWRNPLDEARAASVRDAADPWEAFRASLQHQPA